MSEFTEKFNSSELLWNAVNEIDKDQADVGLLIKIIRNEFKDWQPPKPLVVVPKIVADFIKVRKGGLKLYGAFHEISTKGNNTKLYNWVFKNSDNQSLFARAWIDGYTVNKEKLFYLKNKNTGHILYRQPKEAGGNLIEVVATINEEYTWFTQDEIDKLHIGSYEKIEVEP